MKLENNEFTPFFLPYLNRLSGFGSIPMELERQKNQILNFFRNIPSEKHEFKYQEGKWTIKDILLHLIDTERIFAYRALRISRKDSTPMPGFNENDYVEFAKANLRDFNSLLEEYELVRNNSIGLFKNFNEEQMLYLGTASNSSISVRAIGYIILGHELHHVSVINERYL